MTEIKTYIVTLAGALFTLLAIMNEKLCGAMGGTISVDDAAVGHGLDFTFAAAQAERQGKAILASGWREKKTK